MEGTEGSSHVSEKKMIVLNVPIEGQSGFLINPFYHNMD